MQKTFIQGTIEEHYEAFCSCGILITRCDCPARRKTKVIIRAGCEFCAKIAALQAAEALLASDPCLGKTLRT
ncbi:MAG: hypothetical protein ACRYFS_16305 [Janthinobacterium lividum]